jgi:hypothetical protein
MNPLTMNLRPALAAALLLCGCGLARAATFCATDGAQLNAALIFARANGQSDVIRLATGFYDFPGAGTFEYDPGAAEGSFDIEISGGWTSFFDNPCGQLLDSTDAFDTIITSDTANRLMNIEPSANSSGDVTIRRITFLGGNSTGEGGGLRIYPFSGYTGTILVDQCGFLSNQGSIGAGLRIFSGGTIRVRNSLFDSNNSILSSAVALQSDSGPGIYITNSTIVNNTTDATSTVGVPIDAGLLVRSNGDGPRAFVANNNIWGNEGVDLRLRMFQVNLRNNNIGSVSPPPGGISESINNISVEPMYESGALNYTPAQGSPLIDAGIRPQTITPIPVPFEQNWSTGTLDVFSRARTSGARIDIGAYESIPAGLFADGFE